MFQPFTKCIIIYNLLFGLFYSISGCAGSFSLVVEYRCMIIVNCALSIVSFLFVYSQSKIIY